MKNLVGIYLAIFSLTFKICALGQSLPQLISSEVLQIIDPKVQNVMNQNQIPGGNQNTIGIFDSASSSHIQNGTSVNMSQSVSLGLQNEASQILNGPDLPDGCGNSGTLTDYQKNLCEAANILNAMSFEAVAQAPLFGSAANESWKTMEDTSAFPLDPNLNQFYAYSPNGLPAPGNLLYQSNQLAINQFTEIFKIFDNDGSYKGIKYSTKGDYFYLDGKKYSTQVLNSKEAMIKAGIDKKYADFIYKMLNKKLMQSGTIISDLLKKKGILDKNGRPVIKPKTSISNESLEKRDPGSSYDLDKSGVVDSRPKAEVVSDQIDKTLYKRVDGMLLGLARENIFEIVSRKYREKDKIGFFHTNKNK